MRKHHISPFDQLEPRHGVLVIDGYGIKIRVQAGHLVVEDGVGSVRRIRQFGRATHNLKRLVLIGYSGYITLEALRWLTDLKIGFVHISTDGDLLTTSTVLGSLNPRLRRAQALSIATQTGVDVARMLIGAKLCGQAAVADHLQATDACTTTISNARKDTESATTIEEVLRAELLGAAAYWAAWSEIPMPFVARDRGRIPTHWSTFGTRSSPITKTQRSAANPANAILNYAYSLLEAEARIACHTVGLDPALGFFHTDLPSRDSLPLDLMEAARPAVDRYVLQLIEGHHFRAKDFTETRNGVCRLQRDLASTISETAPMWAAEIAPHAEAIAKTLANDESLRVGRVPTPLTQAHRRAAVAHISQRQRTPTPATPIPDPHCIECGASGVGSGRYCTPCRNDRNDRRLPEMHAHAISTLAKARAEGQDPAHGGEAGRKRSKVMTTRNRQNREWEEGRAKPEPAVFAEEILPGLSQVSAAEMASATGLSRTYCAMIRAGRYVPHPRHWDALRRLESHKRHGSDAQEP